MLLAFIGDLRKSHWRREELCTNPQLSSRSYALDEVAITSPLYTYNLFLFTFRHPELSIGHREHFRLAIRNGRRLGLRGRGRHHQSPGP
jgi:hypothetical protein